MAQVLQRDPRVDPHPGDSLEHPETGNFRKVKSVANRRVHYVMIDAASRAYQRSARLDIWRTHMRGATIVHIQEEADMEKADSQTVPQSVAEMTRAQLTAATLAAHLAYSGGSWIADAEKRAIAVSEPAWQEICRLQKLLREESKRIRKLR